MATHTPKQVEQRYIQAMGPELGKIFNRLFNECALLHLKWNEFVILFGTSPARVQTLNSAAPGFFDMVQDSWWHDILLHISRMTDHRKDVLSVHAMTRRLKPAIRDTANTLLAKAMEKTSFARDIRHRHISHRNLDLALKRPAKPLAQSSRLQVKEGIHALAELINFVEEHYCKGGPFAYEYMAVLGGAESILTIIDRGLKDRDR